jgi:hypothetical protein
MNSKCIFKLISLFFFFFCITTYAQDAKFKLAPYAKGMTNIKNGFFELGPIFYNSKMEIKPFLRIPITDKDRAITQVDMNSNTFKGVISYSYIKDFTNDTGTMSRLYLTGQLEWGTKQFKYFPDSTSASEIKTNENSYSGEFKIGFYKTEGKSFAKQLAPEFRIRYSRELKSSDEIGIVMNNANGISTVQNLVTSKPKAKPMLSPAISINYYPGNGQFSYTPVIYYNLIGKEGENSPFSGYSRLRLESWVFYYPVTTGNTGIKIGLSPFVSVRTTGEDSLNKFEYGGMFQLTVSTNMLHFF